MGAERLQITALEEAFSNKEAEVKRYAKDNKAMRKDLETTSVSFNKAIASLSNALREIDDMRDREARLSTSLDTKSKELDGMTDERDKYWDLHKKIPRTHIKHVDIL